MSKTAIYLRTSTADQKGGIATQKTKINEKLLSLGLTLSDCIIYEDQGQSGAKASRPALDRLHQDSKAGKINRVIVYSFSRYARSTQQLIIALNEFNALGIDFISITEQIDTSTPMGKMIFGVMASLSEFERDMIRERTRAGLERAKASGKKLGQPFKYCTKTAKNLKDQGFTYSEIAEQLGCTKSTAHGLVKHELKKEVA